MLRLRDDHTGSLAELARNPSVPLRVCVDAASCGAEYNLDGVRVLLVADVLIRIAEVSGLQVVTVLAPADRPPAWLERSADALGLHPLTAAGSAGEAEAVLGGRHHVCVAASAAGHGDVRDGGEDGVLVGVAPVDGAAVQAASEGTAGDRLAVRLALLWRPYGHRAALTEADLADAEGTVSRWRHAMARWATEPSRPIPAEAASRISVAFDNDLDTAAALDVLRGLESDRDVPAGAKFETFAFADRVLGLELVREVGR